MTLGLLADAVQDNAQRDTFARPRANELEPRPDDTHEVSRVDARQVLLDPPAVFADVERFTW